MDKAVIESHNKTYGDIPAIVVSCPARFNLLGDYSWFFRDKTISMAVNLPVFIAISPRNDTALRCVFPQANEKKRANLTTLKFRREDRWANAIKAIIFTFQAHGVSMGGMNITVYSQILPSVGFGITTAIKIAMVIALEHLYDVSMNDEELMRVIEEGNKSFLNMRFNSADIFAVLHARRHTCVLTDYQNNSWVRLPFKFDDYVILLTDARVPRISVWNEEHLTSVEHSILLGELKDKKQGVFGEWVYEESDTEINEVLNVVREDMRKRLTGIIKEHQFVLEVADGLNTHDFSRFARAVNHSHDILRDVFTLSCPEIDWLVKRAQEIQNTPSRSPAACSRITGKGFGHGTYTVIKKKDADIYREKLADYDRIFGFHPLCYEVEPSGGISVHTP
jgi:galactokinase